MRHRPNQPRSDMLGCLGYLLVAAVILIPLFWYLAVQDSNCEDAGGVYLWREGKCVKGIEEIDP